MGGWDGIGGVKDAKSLQSRTQRQDELERFMGPNEVETLEFFRFSLLCNTNKTPECDQRAFDIKNGLYHNQTRPAIDNRTFISGFELIRLCDKTLRRR